MPVPLTIGQEYLTNWRRVKAESSVENPTRLRLISGHKIEKVDAKEHPDDFPPEHRMFKMLAYTGKKVAIGVFGEPMVFDLAGMEIAGETLPILRSHNSDRPAGTATAIRKTTKDIKMTGVITTEVEAGAEIAALGAIDFPWQASIGLDVFAFEDVPMGKSELVNGRRIDGPVAIARKSRLTETSVVPFGADSDTMTVILETGDGNWVNATRTEKTESKKTKAEESDMPELIEVQEARDKAIAESKKLQEKLAKFEADKAESDKVECASYVAEIRKVIADKGDVTDPAILSAIEHVEATWKSDKKTAKIIGDLITKACEATKAQKVFESPEDEAKTKETIAMIAEQKKMLEVDKYQVVLSEDKTRIIQATSPKGVVTKF